MEKSNKGTLLEIKLLKVNEITSKKNPYETEKRAMLHELSGIEPIEYLIVLESKNKEIGELTTFQVKEMLNEMGFNVSPAFTGEHHEDLSAVMNIKGFIIPGWQYLPNLFSKKMEMALLTKYSPGKERLHVRLFENNDGKWLIAAHTDINWMNLNISKVYKSHKLNAGAGNYKEGTVLMYALLNKYQSNLEKGRAIKLDEVISTVKEVYRKGVDQMYKKIATMSLLLVIKFRIN